jgi:hypothetical protein
VGGAQADRRRVDEDVSLPWVQSGDQAGDAACGGVAEPSSRHAPALAHPVLEISLTAFDSLLATLIARAHAPH